MRLPRSIPEASCPSPDGERKVISMSIVIRQAQMEIFDLYFHPGLLGHPWRLSLPLASLLAGARNDQPAEAVEQELFSYRRLSRSQIRENRFWGCLLKLAQKHHSNHLSLLPVIATPKQFVAQFKAAGPHAPEVKVQAEALIWSFGWAPCLRISIEADKHPLSLPQVREIFHTLDPDQAVPGLDLQGREISPAEILVTLDQQIRADLGKAAREARHLRSARQSIVSLVLENPKGSLHYYQPRTALPHGQVIADQDRVRLQTLLLENPSPEDKDKKDPSWTPLKWGGFALTSFSRGTVLVAADGTGQKSEPSAQNRRPKSTSQWLRATAAALHGAFAATWLFQAAYEQATQKDSGNSDVRDILRRVLIRLPIYYPNPVYRHLYSTHRKLKVFRRKEELAELNARREKRHEKKPLEGASAAA